MATHKNRRTTKAQLGQFLTPQSLSDSITKSSSITFTNEMKILEPSLGKGAFVFSAIDSLLKEFYSSKDREESIKKILKNNIYGVEYDPVMFNGFIEKFRAKYNIDLNQIEHNFVVSDFFMYEEPTKFDLIIGNPPFGGSFNPSIEDKLDRQYGTFKGYKVKKETYAFFVMKSLESLKPEGQLVFILSDTFLTINTMQGLRRRCIEAGDLAINEVKHFSDETNYGMVVLNIKKSLISSSTILVDKKVYTIADIESSPNFSFKVYPQQAEYFKQGTLSKYITASGGMTIGKNELFLRDIQADDHIMETYKFSFADERISLDKEYQRARLNKISERKLQKIEEDIAAGKTETILNYEKLETPYRVNLPNENYLYYNKSQNKKWYASPKTVIYWEYHGKAVYTFKKNGQWYLHGVGGKPFFKKEGITWSLISSRINARYLPEGYILDSGSPVAILKPSVDKDELYFILGWLNTNKATEILKHTINHTKNIQGKDIERMPYPWWVNSQKKHEAIGMVKQLVNSDKNVKQLESLIEKIYLPNFEK